MEGVWLLLATHQLGVTGAQLLIRNSSANSPTQTSTEFLGKVSISVYIFRTKFNPNPSDAPGPNC
jgi:hypothetical protein